MELVDTFDSMLRIYNELDDIGKSGRFGTKLLRDIREKARSFEEVMSFYEIVKEGGAYSVLSEAYMLANSYEQFAYFYAKAPKEIDIRNSALRKMFDTAKCFEDYNFISEQLPKDSMLFYTVQEKMLESVKTFDHLWLMCFEMQYIEIDSRSILRLESMADCYSHWSALFELAIPIDEKLKNKYLAIMMACMECFDDYFDLYKKAKMVGSESVAKVAYQAIMAATDATFEDWRHVHEECINVDKELQSRALFGMYMKCQCFDDYQVLYDAARRDGDAVSMKSALRGMVESSENSRQWVAVYDSAEPFSLEEDLAIKNIYSS